MQQAIVQAITETQPKAPGQRHRCVFQFARRLMGILGRDADLMSLEPLVMRWHQLAKPNTSGEHTADDSWQDFSIAWTRIYLPGDGDIVNPILEGLAGGYHPVCEARHYLPATAVLATACAILQDLVGDRPFWLSSTDALAIVDGARQRLPQCAGMPKRSRESCWRILEQLVATRVLLLVAKGNQHKANTYRFIWTPEADTATVEPAWITQLLTSIPT